MWCIADWSHELSSCAVCRSAEVGRLALLPLGEGPPTRMCPFSGANVEISVRKGSEKDAVSVLGMPSSKVVDVSEPT